MRPPHLHLRLLLLLQIRKVMNALDNERESRATDVLLGYETVKYFCNEGFELAQYDKATRQYQVGLGGGGAAAALPIALLVNVLCGGLTVAPAVEHRPGAT
jgi:ABC-type transport system involved in Fe-S cluster assembly fused permease/ATPase subunit